MRLTPRRQPSQNYFRGDSVFTDELLLHADDFIAANASHAKNSQHLRFASDKPQLLFGRFSPRVDIIDTPSRPLHDGYDIGLINDAIFAHHQSSASNTDI